MFMADVIKSILSINLFTMALVIYVGYTVVRGFRQKIWRLRRKY
ncbi:DUF6040 family protein [Roseburia intestinalis]